MIIGLTISVILSSVGIQTVNNQNQLVNFQRQYALPNTSTFKLIFEQTMPSGLYERVLQSLSPQTGVMVDYISMNLQDDLIDVQPIYFPNPIPLPYPILSGRLFSKEDLQTAAKVVVVGKEMSKKAIHRNGKLYLKLDGEPYEVIGIIGNADQQIDVLDYKILLPATALSSRVLDFMYGQKEIQLTLFSEVQVTYVDFKKIRALAQSNSNSTIKVYFMDESENETLHAPMRHEEFIVMAFITYALALVNVINISMYWIKERKYEIGIRKAFGYTNSDIFKLIYFELIVIASISIVFGFLIQFVLGRFMSKIIEFPLGFSLQHLFFSIIFIIFTALVTSIIPVMKMIKINPVEAMEHE